MRQLMSWIHLSDLHRGKSVAEERWDQEAILEALAHDVVSNRELGEVDALFFTGDISQSGQPEQFAAAGVWLNKLAASVSIHQQSVYAVPGNHDVDRATEKNGNFSRSPGRP